LAVHGVPIHPAWKTFHWKMLLGNWQVHLLAWLHLLVLPLEAPSN
jgi:hypothetical protein